MVVVSKGWKKAMGFGLGCSPLYEQSLTGIINLAALRSVAIN